MRYLVVDCETSGLSHEKNKVLTVGMLNAKITKSKFEVLKESHVLVKHEDYNPSGLALKINKINLEEHHKVADEPSIACEQISSFVKKNCLKRAPVLGHNLSFDYRFLNALHKQADAEMIIPEHHVDTMHVWRDLKSQNIVPSDSKSSLKTLSKYFGVSYKGAHDALVDCKITAEVYHNLLKLH